jgi:hypothetical protein
VRSTHGVVRAGKATSDGLYDESDEVDDNEGPRKALGFEVAGQAVSASSDDPAKDSAQKTWHVSVAHVAGEGVC